MIIAESNDHDSPLGRPNVRSAILLRKNRGKTMAANAQGGNDSVLGFLFY